MLDFTIYPWRDDLIIKDHIQDGVDMTVVNDDNGLASQPIQMPSEIWNQLQFFNIEDINQKISEGEYQITIDIEQLKTAVYNLDIMGFLDSPRLGLIKKDIEDYKDLPYRPSICERSVYPDTEERLTDKINNIIDLSNYKGDQKPKIIFAPHLDYNTGLGTLKTYSEGFKPLKGHKYKRVLILGTSHYVDNDLVMLADKPYKTPLGLTQIDKESTASLSKIDGFSIDNNAHRNEHSIELHLPFIQHYIEDAEYVIGITGNISYKEYCDNTDYASQIDTLIAELSTMDDGETLFVFSGDLTHLGLKFGDTKSSIEMNELNQQIIKNVERQLNDKDSDGFFKYVSENNHTYKICGLTPFYLGLKLTEGLSVINKSNPYTWEESSTSSSVSIYSIVYG